MLLVCAVHRRLPNLREGAAIILAVLGTLVAYTMYLQGVADVGPVHASMLSSIEPVSATLCSVFWLHTSFQPIDLVGFLCILATIFLLAKKKGEPERTMPDK